jgi:hypothetical protein
LLFIEDAFCEADEALPAFSNFSQNLRGRFGLSAATDFGPPPSNERDRYSDRVAMQQGEEGRGCDLIN